MRYTIRLEEEGNGIAGLESRRCDIHIDESLAAQARLFLHTNVVVVSVPNNYLERFLDDHVIATRDHTTGTRRKARIERKLNQASIFRAWINDGYPLKWGFDKPDEEIE